MARRAAVGEPGALFPGPHQHRAEPTRQRLADAGVVTGLHPQLQAVGEQPGLTLIERPDGPQRTEALQRTHGDRTNHGGDVEQCRAPRSGFAQSPGQPLQRRPGGLIGQGVAGEVDDVVAAHLQMVEGIHRATGLGPAGGDEGALGPRIGHGHAVALVAGCDRADMIHPDLLQGPPGRLGEGPLAQRPRVQGLDPHPAGGGQHVEATADRHGGLVGEHVTAGLGNRLDAQGQVNDDLTGVNDPSHHGRLCSGASG